jgi:hypothetical protein
MPPNETEDEELLRKIHEVLLEVCCMIFAWIRERHILDVDMHDPVVQRL